jgi:hypothetical protein
MVRSMPVNWKLAGAGFAAIASVLVVLAILGAASVHAQTSATTAAATSQDTDSGQACAGLGTPQESGDCNGTGQYGDQTPGADNEAATTEADLD